MKCGLTEMRWNMNDEVNNVTSPSLSLKTLQASQKQMLHTFYKQMFVCLFVFVSLSLYRITQFVQLNLFVYKKAQFFQLAGIWLTIQHSSKYLFGFLIISPDFVLTGGVVIFEGISVLACTTIFRDVVLLGSMILS